MRARHRLVLATAERVAEFFATHAPENPTIEALLVRLIALIEQFRLLGEQEANGEKSKVGANRARGALARELRYFLLTPLGKLAATIFKADPGHAAHYRMTSRAARTNEGFLIGARAVLANLRADLQVFVAEGLPADFMETLAAAIKEYEKLPLRAVSGKLAATNAREGVDGVTTEIMEILSRLDSLNRIRFRTDPALAPEWELIRSIPWPKPAKQAAAARKAKKAQGPAA